MHDRTRLVLARLHRFRIEHLNAGLHRSAVPLAVRAGPFAEALRQQFAPAPVGAWAAWAWGRPRGTVWIRVQGIVPSGRRDAQGAESTEVVIDLRSDDGGPGFQAEATVFDARGRIVKGIEPRNNHIPVLAPGDAVDFSPEAAANPHISEHGWLIRTDIGSKETAGQTGARYPHADLQHIWPVVMLQHDGEHTLRYSLRFGAAVAGAVDEGYRLNVPQYHGRPRRRTAVHRGRPGGRDRGRQAHRRRERCRHLSPVRSTRRQGQGHRGRRIPGAHRHRDRPARARASPSPVR